MTGLQTQREQGMCEAGMSHSLSQLQSFSFGTLTAHVSMLAARGERRNDKAPAKENDRAKVT